LRTDVRAALEVDVDVVRPRRGCAASNVALISVFAVTSNITPLAIAAPAIVVASDFPPPLL
jgi:hypothetical protein